MPKEKSPFVNYSLEEILALEAYTYIIQVGSEFYSANGKTIFNKRSAAIHYNRILRELLSQLNSNNRRLHENAKRVLMNFKIIPFRVH